MLIRQSRVIIWKADGELPFVYYYQDSRNSVIANYKIYTMDQFSGMFN